MAAAITPLPKAPDIVLGVISLQGRIIPVVNMRRRFRLPEPELRTCDQFLIARTNRRTVALVVDGTEGILELDEASVLAPGEIVAGTSYLEGVASTEQGLVLIHDLATLLFPEEEELLSQALAIDEV